MHRLRHHQAYRTGACIVAALALGLGACVYRPVVVDDYSEASSYTDLLAGIDDDARLAEAIDRNVERVFRPGDQIAGWSENGIYLEDVLATKPGGTMDNVVLSERAGDIAISSERDFADLFGPEYVVYAVSGTNADFAPGRDDRSFGLVRIGDGVWMETSSLEEKMGKASCSQVNSAAARLYTRREFADLNKLEKSMLAAYAAGAQRNGGKVCTVSEADGEGRWRTRYFLPDGRRLPVFDREGSRTKIIPRTEVTRLIAG
ncbi:hypothetical protein [Pseudopontixanthobacter vadosimaris]|uniref:hypothetical protein n=1 Tax=Pseudopontixanthobacter vadosimaris TaxID=2726450 RepID=UPI0014744646|nr:hypothetical protein [Pseudopontixanthobacter vadosimaris]